jgi:PAS domain S-box-containing protein/diguanylate cyclase (GGDEF)-like protein
MSLLNPQPEQATTPFLSFLEKVPPLRVGVITVVALTVGYASINIMPGIHRDLQLLRGAYAVDEQGVQLEEQLQVQIQASRRKFLRSLLAAQNAPERNEELRAMRDFDVSIAGTESRLDGLGFIPAANQKAFQQSWLNYLTLRDRMLATTISGDAEAARKIDKDLGGGAFRSVMEAAQSGESAFQASSNEQIRKVSDNLNGELSAIRLLIAIKIAVLVFLLWLDSRRVKAENQLQQTTHDLKASEDRFREAYDAAAVGMGSFTLDGTAISVNRTAAQILGYEPGELEGKNFREFIALECRADHQQQHASLLRGEAASYTAERRMARKDGSTIWVRNRVALLQAGNEEPHLFVTSEDITHEKESCDRLAYLANYDPVTNLPNRRYFEERLAAELQSTSAHPDALALLYLEIDSFDFLKGTFGPTVADEILGEVGADLAAFTKDGEIIGRLDDHAFGLLVRAAAYDEATMIRGGELREVFRKAGETGKHRIPLSASIGIAYASDGIYGASGTEMDSAGWGHVEQTTTSKQSKESTPPVDTWLMTHARAAMLEARSRGGDSIYIADPGLQEQATQRHRIETALLRGLREDEFRVVFQPQFEVQTGNLVRFEALCRWNSAELGTVPPDRFIPIAEQTGLIIEIGRRVLHDALRQAKSWTQTGRRIGVAVNISPMQFMRPDFTLTVTAALAATGFPPALLELEITEGIFIRDLNLAVARIRELQRLGLTIALDDFGTGYSSLSYLRRMPIDAVKLDRSFVSDLTTDVATMSMVRSVMAMASALNLRVVTEGVETEQQLEVLRSLGCDEAQGYLLGRPEPAEMALQRVIEAPSRVMAKAGV